MTFSEGNFLFVSYIPSDGTVSEMAPRSDEEYECWSPFAN